MSVPPNMQPAGNFGIGPGIARPINNNLYERYRHGNHPPHGEHLNLEIILKSLEGKRTRRLVNIHIDLND